MEVKAAELMMADYGGDHFKSVKDLAELVQMTLNIRQAPCLTENLSYSKLLTQIVRYYYDDDRNVSTINGHVCS